MKDTNTERLKAAERLLRKAYDAVAGARDLLADASAEPDTLGAPAQANIDAARSSCNTVRGELEVAFGRVEAARTMPRRKRVSEDAPATARRVDRGAP